MGIFGERSPRNINENVIDRETAEKGLAKCDELVKRLQELYKVFNESSSEAKKEIAQNYSSSMLIGQPQNYDIAMQKSGISRESNIQIGDALYSYLEALIKELSDIQSQSLDDEKKQDIIRYKKLYNEISAKITGVEKDKKTEGQQDQDKEAQEEKIAA